MLASNLRDLPKHRQNHRQRRKQLIHIRIATKIKQIRVKQKVTLFLERPSLILVGISNSQNTAPTAASNLINHLLLGLLSSPLLLRLISKQRPTKKSFLRFLSMVKTKWFLCRSPVQNRIRILSLHGCYCSFP